MFLVCLQGGMDGKFAAKNISCSHINKNLPIRVQHSHNKVFILMEITNTK